MKASPKRVSLGQTDLKKAEPVQKVSTEPNSEKNIANDQELTSEKLLILLLDGPSLELIVSSHFQALLLLQSVGKRLIPVKKSKNSWIRPSRINSVLVSARTVILPLHTTLSPNRTRLLSNYFWGIFAGTPAECPGDTQPSRFFFSEILCDFSLCAFSAPCSCCFIITKPICFWEKIGLGKKY